MTYLSVLKTVLLFLSLSLLTGLVFLSLNFSTDVSALGNMEIEYLDQESEGPLYDKVIMYPGECESRHVSISNNAQISSKVYVAAVKNFGELSDGLDIEISSQGTSKYKNTLDEFYIQSADSAGAATLVLEPNEHQDVRIKICMSSGLTNTFFNKKDNFDLIFREVLIDIEVPNECASIAASITKKVSGSGKIMGTDESELIVGQDTNDHINGGGGNDCILSYGGNDRVTGGGGDDVIILGKGNDHALGGKGDDTIDGQDGNDNLNGESGENTCKNGEITKKCQNR